MIKANKYKRNFMVLLWGILVLVLLSYKLAVKRTIDEYKILKTVSMQLEQIENAPLHIQMIDKKLRELDTLIGNSRQSSNPQEILLEYAGTAIRGDIIVSELPEAIKIPGNDFLLCNQTIVFQGPFTGLLKLLRKLEKEKRIGNIASVSFYTQKEKKTSVEYLKMKVLIQSVKPEQ